MCSPLITLNIISVCMRTSTKHIPFYSIVVAVNGADASEGADTYDLTDADVDWLYANFIGKVHLKLETVVLVIIIVLLIDNCIAYIFICTLLLLKLTWPLYVVRARVRSREISIEKRFVM